MLVISDFGPKLVSLGFKYYYDWGSNDGFPMGGVATCLRMSLLTVPFCAYSVMIIYVVVPHFTFLQIILLLTPKSLLNLLLSFLSARPLHWFYLYTWSNKSFSSPNIDLFIWLLNKENGFLVCFPATFLILMIGTQKTKLLVRKDVCLFPLEEVVSIIPNL